MTLTEGNERKELPVRKLLIAALGAVIMVPVYLAMPTLESDSVSAQEAPPAPDCNGYGALAKETYKTHRWWETADATPATKKEDRRLDAFVRDGCPSSERREQEDEYDRFYRQVIAPCEAAGDRWANCAVAQCESGYGRGGSSIYGFLDYWSAIEVLPVKGNKTGTRFAPSSFSATKLEQDVVAAAAFKFGPTPGTCAS